MRCYSELPMIAEVTGSYLESRVELNDKPGEVVFRVGCRLTNSPLSVFHEYRKDECMKILKSLYGGFNANCSVISIPRVEYSKGGFCLYREAYTYYNKAMLGVMLNLDEEKKVMLEHLGIRPIDIMQAGGFLKGWESSFEYSESSDRAISPTSIRLRYITEDMLQGLALLESIAHRIGLVSWQ